MRPILAALTMMSTAMCASAQFGGPQTNNDPFSKTVPSGPGACSVAKSCVEVAPSIIKAAETSPAFAANLQFLLATKGKRPSGSAEEKKTMAWAVDAFRKSGYVGVKTETVTLGHGRTSQNVIAEISGRDLPQEFVIVAAHLDSPVGESDPASSQGAAAVIEAARAVHASGSLPRRSIRFVLFTGSANDMAGTHAYVLKHSGELDQIVAVITADGGGKPISGFSLEGRKELIAPVQKELQPVRSLGVDDFTSAAEVHRDTIDFLLEGIPTLAASYGSSAPTAGANTLSALKKDAAILSVTAYALADTESRIGSRQSRTKIEEMLQETGLATKMKSEKLWALWQAGRRGRKP